MNICFFKHKNIYACLLSIHNTTSLSCHEQVLGPMIGEVSLET